MRKYQDIIFLTFCILITLAIWWPYRNLPYFWDSSGFVINAANDLYHSNLLPWIAAHSNFAHPPFLMTLLALAWKIQGQFVVVSHLVMWPFLPILVYSTYVIAKKTQTPYPFIPSILTLFLPFVLAEYVNIYIDLPAAALATASIAALLSHKLFLSVLLLTLATLTKETALLIAPGIFIYLFFLHFEQNSQKYLETINSTLLWKKNASFIIPVLVFLLYLVYHHQITGWYLIEPGRQFRPFTITIFIDSIKYVVEQLMFTQGRGLLSIIGIISFISLLKSKSSRAQLYTPVNLLFATVFVSGILFFSYVGEFALRYAIVIFPYYLLLLYKLFTLAWQNYIKSYLRLGVLTLVTLCLYISYPHIHPIQSMDQSFIFSPPDDMRIVDMMNVYSQAAVFLEYNHPNSTIYGAFPENQQLTQTYQGYIKSSLQFIECPADYNLTSSDQPKILYLHLYSPIQQYCGQILMWHEHELISKFEQNGKWVALFSLGNKLETPQQYINL